MKIVAPRALDSSLFLLVGLSLISALIYALVLRTPYPLAAGLAHPQASWASLAGFSWRAGLALICGYALLTAYYMLALRVAAHGMAQYRRALLLVIVGGWLLSSVVLLGAYPGESLDIFDYLFRGRLQVTLGISPLATPPFPYANQLFYPYVNWPINVDTYGPLWEYASGAVAAIVGILACDCPAGLASYVLGYRLLAIGLAGLCGLLIYAITAYRSPQVAPAALLAWLWNPLLLTATAVGAHNDMLMLLLMLTAVLLVQRQRWLLGLIVLILAAHVKLTALLILPVVGLWMARRVGWWRAMWISGAAGVLALALSWLLYAPLGGWATLPRMLGERVRLIANSPAFVVYWALQRFAGWSEILAWRVSTQGATVLFFALAGVLLARFWRATRNNSPPDDGLLWRGSIAVTVAFLLVGSFWIWQWYLLWVLVLAALLPTSRFTATVLPACCAGVLSLHSAADFLIRHGRVATPIALADGLSSFTWIVLAAGALGLAALWRVTWHTDNMRDLSESFWISRGPRYVHYQQRAGTTKDLPK
ncbi:MAG: glycosyltransferase family 87 protein [Roseiflexaceae bacterium]